MVSKPAYLLRLYFAIAFVLEPTTSFELLYTHERPIKRFVQPIASCQRKRFSSRLVHGELLWLTATTPGSSDHRIQLPLESPFEDERRPRRLSPSVDDTHYDYRVDTNDWGIEFNCDPKLKFPSTIDELTEAAFEAVAGSLYNKQRLDPNVASNAMSRSILGYRPVRPPADIGRIGVEIDGAHHLLPQLSEGSAIRRVALVLAAKLSEGYWEGFEEDGHDLPKSRPVVIYYNTIKQSLIASQELQLLKRAEVIRTGDKATGKYDNVTILCLGQGGDIPSHMLQLEKKSRRRAADIGRGQVNPLRGILLVVQPTDYNDEFEPHGPSIGSAGALQKLVARASIQELSTVVLSPRFLAAQDQTVSGWDQSGFQQSATFGGAEPPSGPSPWIMRDFTPPVFCWVASSLRRSPLRYDSIRKYYWKMGLMQSVMHAAHPWHIFAADDSGDFQYIASTKTSSGRPTKDLIISLFGERIG